MKQSKKSKQLPFSTEHFLDIVGDASARSRQFLLLLVFTGILILMAVVNSFPSEYNWFKSRLELRGTILKYFHFKTEKPDSLCCDKCCVAKLSLFIIDNEQLNKNNIDTSALDTMIKKTTILSYKQTLKVRRDSIVLFLRNIDKEYPISNPNVLLIKPIFVPIKKDINSRYEMYEKIGHAIKYVQDRNIYSKGLVKSAEEKMYSIDIEYFNLVKVPILGIAFDINYLGVYSGIVLTVLYFLLYFSLTREYISLKIAFKRGWTDIKHHHYYLYEYVSMLQVLSIPQKLFSPHRKLNIFYQSFPYAAILFPLSVYILIVIFDLKTLDIGNDTNEYMTALSTVLSSIFAIVIIAINIYIVTLWGKMDNFWNNQAHEFNFEYILECLGEDETIDLLDFSDKNLSPSDLDCVKAYWYYKLDDFLRKNKKFNNDKAMNVFSSFLDSILSDSFKAKVEEERRKISHDEKRKEKEKQLQDEYWVALTDWFKSSGRKNVGSGFRESFGKMIEGILEYHTSSNKPK